jgi:lipopolysaccharide/colanic/teichoic acid biosynthesis glycosyltransferase
MLDVDGEYVNKFIWHVHCFNGSSDRAIEGLRMTREQRALLARSIGGTIQPAHGVSPGIRPHLGTPDLHVVHDSGPAQLPHLFRFDASRANRGFGAACAAVFKRTVDVAGALALGLMLSPFIIAVVIAISVEGGSVIYRHRRIGKNGKAFDCLKFRTMVANADQVLKDLLNQHPELREEWLRDHKLRDDPRITVVGRFLRRTSLDELPQLWNILRGDMSLVGPRPVVWEELFRYGRNAVSYLAVKPGLTGLWQISGRNDVSYRRRVAMDVYYVRNRNLLLDLYILALTTSVIFNRDGGAY